LEDGAVMLRQGADGAADARDAEPLQDDHFRLRHGERSRMEVVVPRFLTQIAAELLALVEPVVLADLEQIGGEAAGRLVALPGEPEAQERLLDEVVRLRAVRDQRGEEAPQRLAVAAE